MLSRPPALNPHDWGALGAARGTPQETRTGLRGVSDMGNGRVAYTFRTTMNNPLISLPYHLLPLSGLHVYVKRESGVYL
jgi:hypothetical protein